MARDEAEIRQPFGIATVILGLDPKEKESMASDLKRQLFERFAKGIRKSFKPCPLIGPKWLQEFPGGRPADFRFFGVGKLSKAIGCTPAKIVQIMMRNVSLTDLDVNVKVLTGWWLIDINRNKKPRPVDPGPAAEPARRAENQGGK